LQPDITKALDDGPFLLFTVDKKGNLCSIAGREVKKLNLDIKAILGKSVFKTKNFPVTRTHLKHSLSGVKSTFTVNIKGFIYETILSPIISENGDTIGSSGFSTDVTKRIEMEQAIDEERYRATAAQRINSLAGMANGLAHEINNPLAIISGFSQQLQELAKGENLENPLFNKGLDRIISNSDRIHTIITSLQNFSRDAGNDPFESVDIREVFETIEQLYIRRFEIAGVELQIALQEEEISFFCRKVQIMQTLFNLTINALEAASQGENGWVRVSVQSSRQYIEVSVSDSGPGIPMTNASKIFEPFFTTKEVGKGTGLGLSTARGIASSHSGTLDLDSKAQNTTFILRLPANQAKQSAS